MKKVCSKCGEEKELNCFSKNASCKYGANSQCKECEKKHHQIYYQLNKIKIKEKVKQYRDNNQTKLSEYKKEYYQKNKKQILENAKIYREKNKNKIEKTKRKCFLKNKKKYLDRQEKWRKQEMINNKLFLLKLIVGNRIRRAIYDKGYDKKSNTKHILGCSYEKFKRHLESQFKEGMTWDNYGRNGWHIDHIYPVSKARDKEHLLELNHYTNLQPLWEKDNLSKGNRLDWSE